MKPGSSVANSKEYVLHVHTAIQNSSGPHSRNSRDPNFQKLLAIRLKISDRLNERRRDALPRLLVVLVGLWYLLTKTISAPLPPLPTSNSVRFPS